MPPDFVALTSRFTSGWPWPESSWGLDPMYGEDGWCRSCGVPSRPQTSSLVLQASKFPTSNFWMPNWQYDALCVRTEPAAELLREFDVRVLPVRTPRAADVGVSQLLPVIADEPWFPADALRSLAVSRHGREGQSCSACGVWRWLPLTDGELPRPAFGRETGESDVVASKEWFGDGMKAMRVLRFRRPLAEALVALNPKVWSVVEVADKSS